MKSQLLPAAIFTTFSAPEGTPPAYLAYGEKDLQDIAG